MLFNYCKQAYFEWVDIANVWVTLSSHNVRTKCQHVLHVTLFLVLSSTPSHVVGQPGNYKCRGRFVFETDSINFSVTRAFSFPFVYGKKFIRVPTSCQKKDFLSYWNQVLYMVMYVILRLCLELEMKSAPLLLLSQFIKLLTWKSLFKYLSDIFLVIHLTILYSKSQRKA